MAHHRDVGKDTVGNGHLQGDGAAKALGRGGVHAVAVGGRRGEFFFHRRCGGRRLRRQRVIDHLAGQRVFDGTQNAPGSVGGFRHGVHLPGLGVQHGAQQPLCPAQEGAGLVGGAQHLHIGDAAALHGHLHLHGAAEAPGGAGVDAVGIGQHGGQALGFFFRGCGGLCGRRGRGFGQTFRHGGQHRRGARHGDQHKACHGHGGEQLHQRQQPFPGFRFPHEIPLSDTETRPLLFPGATLFR